MSNFIVMKFGGTSQCAQGINVILSKITEYVNSQKKIILVISAVNKTTNDLYKIIDSDPNAYENLFNVHKSYCENINVDFDIIKPYLDELKQDMIDYKYKPFCSTSQLKLKIISWGEILASKIVFECLKNHGINVDYLNAHRFMKNRSHSDNIDNDTLNLKGAFYCDKDVLSKLITNYDVYVTQGFIATTSDNKLCVLTRSGSNTSASLIANSVDAEKLEIFTDVSGIYSGDPRKIANTKVIPFARYDVCLEASSTGTQLIHPFSLKPCSDKHIPIHIKNTFDPDSTGTIINGFDRQDLQTVHLISVQNDVTIFKIFSLDMSEGYGFMSDIFSVFKDEKIDVNIVLSSLFEISTTTNEKSLTKINKAKEKLSERYEVDLIGNCSIVSVIADSVLKNRKIQDIYKFVDLSEITIHMIHLSSNKLALSYVVPNDEATKLANLLHENLL